MQHVLANGARIPAIGFGTYGMERADMLRMIPAALKGGFRHIDTGQIYRNEAEVGECTVSSGVPRSDLFITTKVWVANYPASRFAASVDQSLRDLQTDYIDLLLLHWPHDSVPLAEQIGLLNETVRSGKVRHIGVSNFNRQLLEQAIGLSAAPLVTNQFEYHPYLSQSLLGGATRQAGLAVTAYCAMAVGRVAQEHLAAPGDHRRISLAQTELLEQLLDLRVGLQVEPGVGHAVLGQEVAHPEGVARVA